jgi:hypothetical protein
MKRYSEGNVAHSILIKKGNAAHDVTGPVEKNAVKSGCYTVHSIPSREK